VELNKFYDYMMSLLFTAIIFVGILAAYYIGVSKNESELKKLRAKCADLESQKEFWYNSYSDLLNENFKNMSTYYMNFEAEYTEEEIDLNNILDKISKNGFNSLTNRELEYLKNIHS
jgi:hypothetical protein